MRNLLFAGLVAFTANTGHGQLVWSVDTSFHTDLQLRSVSDIEFRDDGLLISGQFRFTGDPNIYGSALLDYDGHFVAGNAGGGWIIPWSDYLYLGIGAGVRRMFSDYTVDYSYPGDSPFISSIHGGQFYVYPDGKVLITGGHDLWSRQDTSFLGPQYCLVRMDADGLPDSTFHHRQCQSGVTQQILRLADGKFLLSGVQNLYDGQPVGHILRVEADGTIDATFQTTVDYGYATDYYFYPDGRILCAGLFHTPEMPNDTVQLLRLMPDGSVDPSFNYNLRFQKFPGYEHPPATVIGMYLLDSATLLIGGAFTNLNDEFVGGIAVIDTSGNILQDYFPGMGCDSLVFTVGLVPNLYLGLRDFEMGPDGMLYVYGSFHGFDDGYVNDPDQRLIMRLKQVNVGVEEQTQTSVAMDVWPNPGDDQLTIKTKGLFQTGRMIVRDVLGRILLDRPYTGSQIEFDTREWAPGVYGLEARAATSQRTTTKWIKQ